MGRKPRDLTTSQWQHIGHRGNDRQDIFSGDGDRVLFELLMAESFERFGVELHAYVLMSNHVHLLVRFDDDGLSPAMQRLFGCYASAYNQRTQRDGSLFAGRFHSQPVTSDAQLTQVARYIHRNPLAFVPAAALGNYRWSSLGAMCGYRDRPSWLTTGIVAAGLEGRQYLDEVLAPQPSDRFQYGPIDQWAASISCADIDEQMVALAGCDRASLRNPDNRAMAELRMLAITLATDLRVASQVEIAQHYGLSDARSVRRIARRGRVRSSESQRFARLIEQTRRHMLGSAA